MDRNKSNSFLISIVVLSTLFFANCRPSGTDKSTITCNEFEITDSNLIKAIDQYIVLNNCKKEDCLLRLFVEHIPLKKSFVIMNSYSADDLKINGCMYFSKHKGFDVAIYTGIEKYLKEPKPIPNDLDRFMKGNQEAKLYNYFSYKYEYDITSKADTFYKMESNFYLIDPNNSALKFIPSK